jgi:hypothetical protein
MTKKPVAKPMAPKKKQVAKPKVVGSGGIRSARQDKIILGRYDKARHFRDNFNGDGEVFENIQDSLRYWRAAVTPELAPHTLAHVKPLGDEHIFR